ncbi:hypothetical protein ABZS53_14930 [Streptomyces sp. NPDC005499]|uniref:hypothetical protein n=1 Tax=Streptomyces sp. NPDC005499 TaxID=3154883 RepID=UPI0033BAB835
MLRAAVLVISVALIAIGGFLVCSAATGNGVPQDLPKPTDQEPLGDHVCMSTVNGPTWCEDI